jgi:hypothetical protein
MMANSRIGFHAAFDIVSRQETGVGNAVIGAYLTRLGLPYSVVIYATKQGPDGMQWLS